MTVERELAGVSTPPFKSSVDLMREEEERAGEEKEKVCQCCHRSFKETFGVRQLKEVQEGEGGGVGFNAR